MAKPLSVHQVSDYISRILKEDPRLSRLYMTGEISNVNRSSGGHIFFDIKDEKANISCVIWGRMSLAKSFNYKDGDKVNLKGEITTFQKASRYQILVKEIEDLGVGALFKAYEELKKKLLEEGLFNPELKKELPEYPKKIGVVTSPTGAAVQDILKTIERRYWISEIYFHPAKVQGKGAELEIEKGLRALDSLGLDVIIFGRGGGSFEDLNAFNQESLIRTIFEMKTPTISAVGHEVDHMLTDFVADVRAATPTAAAELATKNLSQEISNLRIKEEQIRQQILRRIENSKNYLDHQRQDLNYYSPIRKIQSNREKLASLEREFRHFYPLKKLEIRKEELGKLKESFESEILFKIEEGKNFLKTGENTLLLKHPSSRLASSKRELQYLKKTLETRIKEILSKEKMELTLLKTRMNSCNPKNMLEKGYTKITKNGKTIYSVEDLNLGEDFSFTLQDGKIYGSVERKEQ